MFFLRKKFSVGKFDGKKILSLTWADKNILFIALCALKNNNLETNFAALRKKLF